MGRMKAHLNELKANGVITGPLQSEDSTGWISNPVITGNRWYSDQDRVNLDLQNMKKAARPTHFPMPTGEDLR